MGSYIQHLPSQEHLIKYCRQFQNLFLKMKIIIISIIALMILNISAHPHRMADSNSTATTVSSNGNASVTTHQMDTTISGLGRAALPHNDVNPSILDKMGAILEYKLKPVQRAMNKKLKEVKKDVAGIETGQAKILFSPGRGVRLVGQDGKIYYSSKNGPTSGRLEVLVDGRWGTVCDDSFEIGNGGNWQKDPKDPSDSTHSTENRNNLATVVCRMLGKSSGNAYGLAKFGPGSGDIFMDNVECTGSEDTIFKCKYVTENCDHKEDVGVTCN